MRDVRESLPPASSSEGLRAGSLFDLLEERVASLVERQRDARKSVEELDAQIEERDALVAALKEQLAAADDLKRDLHERVSRLIARIDALEAQQTASAGEARG